MLNLGNIVEVRTIETPLNRPKTLVVINIDKYDTPISIIKINSAGEFLETFGKDGVELFNTVSDVFRFYWNKDLDIYCAKSGTPINSDGYDYVVVF